MSGVEDCPPYDWLCSLQAEVADLHGKNTAACVRISELEAEVAQLRGEDGGCLQGLQRLSEHVRSMFGKSITTMEQFSRRLADVEVLKEEKGKRLKALEDDVNQLKGEAGGWKRARGSIGGF